MTFVGFLAFAVLYFTPTITALIRKVNRDKVFAINLLLGWTILGYFYALALANRARPTRATP